VSEIDQQFIEYVVKSLVGKPDEVHIDRRIDEKGVLLELTVDPEDLGRVIGKRGATAQSLRTLLRALGTKNDARYNLKIIDNGPEDHAHHDAPAPVAAASTADDTVTPVADNYQPADDSRQTVVADDEPADTSSTADAPAPVTDEDTDTTSDRVRQARAELADLDDLDV
jgi:predicted RNA-binding protein YlqC (UPF0109 family)